MPIDDLNLTGLRESQIGEWLKYGKNLDNAGKAYALLRELERGYCHTSAQGAVASGGHNRTLKVSLKDTTDTKVTGASNHRRGWVVLVDGNDNLKGFKLQQVAAGLGTLIKSHYKGPNNLATALYVETGDAGEFDVDIVRPATLTNATTAWVDLLFLADRSDPPMDVFGRLRSTNFS